MDGLKKQINQKLKEIKQMIEKEDKSKIEEKRKELDKLLEEYIKDI